MIHETKQGIFDDLLRHSLGVTRVLLGQNGNQDLFDRQVAMDFADWKARYDAAPAEAVKVPKAIIELIKLLKVHGDDLTDAVDVDYLVAAYHTAWITACDNANWIDANGDTFAAAWLTYPNVEVSEDE